jgi:hypothetical protein
MTKMKLIRKKPELDLEDDQLQGDTEEGKK